MQDDPRIIADYQQYLLQWRRSVRRGDKRDRAARALLGAALTIVATHPWLIYHYLASAAAAAPYPDAATRQRLALEARVAAQWARTSPLAPNDRRTFIALSRRLNRGQRTLEERRT